MQIKIPDFSLVILIGVSGSGKSTFARRHFQPWEIVSSDDCRGIVSNDENNQAASKDAFELLHFILSKRLKNRLLTVVDATNLQPESRFPLIQLARDFHCIPVAVVFDLPAKLCAKRNAERTDRAMNKHALRNQSMQFRTSIKRLEKEGFRYVHYLETEEEVNSIEIFRDRLYNDKRDLTGPFDIIGDIHGCADELKQLLNELGYAVEQFPESRGNYGYQITAPEGRKVIFLGDLVDRGPDSPAVLKMVMTMVKDGSALCVPGNHDINLHRYLTGRKKELKHGLDLTVQQLEKEPVAFRNAVRDFIDSLVSHYLLDEGKLVVAHAGLPEEMHGRGSGAVRAFCLYGETTGETDEFGLPVRYNWATDYRGEAFVVYGHTAVLEPQWYNRTIDIDTGCVYGGKLTALRYPEREVVSVDAAKVYCEPSRPIRTLDEFAGKTGGTGQDDLPDIEDVTGRRNIHTRLAGYVTLREENSIAALEVMSRFAIHPRWLIYLPPTMSPPEASKRDDLLEHPQDAFDYFIKRGVKQVICEEKHMGSRAIVVVCRNEEEAVKRFGIRGNGPGICYTRTGRNFFTDEKLEREFLERVSHAVTLAGAWEKFNTGWMALDCELMPWSAKAQQLIREQYASVSAAASLSLPEAARWLDLTAERGIAEAGELKNKFADRSAMVELYADAFRRYCWEVESLSDYKLAPFHLLATEGAVHMDKNHLWHMNEIEALCKADPGLLQQTVFRVVNLGDSQEISGAIQWWTELTAAGGEGMVMKPLDFVHLAGGKTIQPAIKCRGREYLRIIYGPEYLHPDNLRRLKNRGLSHKRGLAMREFALGEESLNRFVKREPLRKVHECVFGVLALESEEIDPRL